MELGQPAGPRVKKKTKTNTIKKKGERNVTQDKVTWQDAGALYTHRQLMNK
jgi:hypothetical protein